MQKLWRILPILCVLLCAQTQAESAGVITEQTFTDPYFEYDLTIPDGWDAEIATDSTGLLRLVLYNSDFPLPATKESIRPNILPPTIYVLADTSTQRPEEFYRYLAYNGIESPQDEAFLEAMPLLDGNHHVIEGTTMTHRHKHALQLEVRRPFEGDLPITGSDRTVERNTDLAGLLYFMRRENKIVVLHCMCERPHAEEFFKTFEAVFNSFEFNVPDSIKSDSDPFRRR